MRRFLFILSIVLAVLLLGAGYYFLRPYIAPKNAPISSPDTSTDVVDSSLPVAPFGGTPLASSTGDSTGAGAGAEVGVVSLLYNTELFDYWIDPSDRSVFLVVRNGKIIKAGVGGERETLFSFNPTTYRGIVPSPDGSQFILLSEEVGEPSATLVTTKTGEQTSLQAGIVSAAWSPDAREIALLVEPSLTRSGGLYIFTVSRGTRQLAVSLQLFDAILSWPAPNAIYLTEKPSYEVPGSLFIFSPTQKTLTEKISDIPGLMGEWSLDWGVFSSSNQETLTGLRADGSYTKLPVWTLAPKCTIIAGATICGVPYNSFRKTQTPDTYLQQDMYTLDSVVALRPDGSQETLFNGANSPWNLDVYKPKKVGDMLYFINRYDNSLYGLTVDL